ncbi:MAG: biopolymer transporter ExbD [Ferruginibacter sp.]|nr:biopolymer transporter ExbD [Chitinophagaceae bacterium]MBP6286964.1 biopolymer transporter ExbD [Ferruginibacter sp.]
MAEAEIKRSSRRNNRMHKKSTRVDLTPMVDLGFLLITFFVFTTTMSLPKVMGFNESVDTIPGDEICNSCVLTLFLEKGNVIRYYEGTPDHNPVVKQTSFSVKGIRDVLLAKKEEVSMATGDAKRFVLIIKPAVESTVQNFVDIIDEVAIHDIKRYYVSEIDAADRKILYLP